jgi:hypothetical protein
MSAVRFDARPVAAGDEEFDIGISDDGQVFTLRFAGMQAVVDAGKASDLTAARVFSAVLRLDGADTGVDISFATAGSAFATEGASGTAILSVNGQTAVRQFQAGTDEEFAQQLRFQAGPTAACHLSLVALVQRDPAHPEASATLLLSTVDAAIQPR